jgi:hypothetical protein
LRLCRLTHKTIKMSAKIDLTSKTKFACSLETRILRYLEKCPPSVSGHCGHDKALYVACALINGFGLELDEALPFFLEWNQYCQPPWNRKELIHKLMEAHKIPHRKPVGHLLNNKKYWTERELVEIDWNAAIYMPDPNDYLDWSKAVYMPEHIIETAASS